MSYRILFVDDDPASMEPYRRHLKTIGYDPIERARVRDALEAFGSERFDLLVLDLMMPPGPLENVVSAKGMDTGKHLYLKARTRDRYVPIVIFTNVDDLVDLQIYEDDPNLYVFRKENFLPSEFANKLKEILKSQESGPPPTEKV